MLLLIPTWVVLFFVLLGWGAGFFALLFRFGGRGFKPSPDPFQVFWLGFALLLGFLQLYSVFLPINRYTVLSVSLLAVVGVVLSAHLLIKLFRHTFRQGLRFWFPMGLTVCTITLLVAYYSSLPVSWYDTHLYHLNAVKWAGEYPAVPGLVNLHGRLAFNSSFHLFAAFTDVWIWQDKSAHVALGFLLSVVSVQWLAYLTHTARRYKDIVPKVFCMLTFPFILARIFSTEAASLSTDLALSLLCLVIVLEILRLPPIPLSWSHKLWVSLPQRCSFQLLLLCSLGTAVVTIKLSGLPVFLLVSSLALVVLTRKERSLSKWKRMANEVLVLTALPGILLLGFFTRNVILSGWLLYPFPIGNMHLPWSAPVPGVLNEINWIKSWARMPGKFWDQVLGYGFFHWFIPWFDKFRSSREFILFLAAGVALMVDFTSRTIRNLYEPFYLPVTAAVICGGMCIVFWFITAPDLRFGSVFFWILFAASLSPILAIAAWNEFSGKVALLTLVFLLTYWAGGFDIHIPSKPSWVEIQAVPAKPTKPVVVENGQTPPL